MTLKKVVRKSLSEAVFDQLSEEIVHGNMEPGQRLPAERELCEALGVNRGACREALQRLAQAGLISIQHGGSTKVLDYRASGGLDLLGRLLFRPDGGFSIQVARSILEMRAALGPDIAALCARRAKPELKGQLREVVTALSAAGEDLNQRQLLGMRFWDLLARGSGNIAYQLANNTLRKTYEKIRHVLTELMRDELLDHKSHQAIAEAIFRGDDLSAKHVTRGLLEKGTSRMLQFLARFEKAQNKESKT
ncbi:MAG: FadR family transcriptional regulator [Planctomycetota bacterium]|nr:MAG: FadR family transcriptional regulator [Planctomycetota bacterium]